MDRTPEPDLMNDRAQALAYANADFSVPHNAFIEHLSASFPHLPITGYALDLGCGPGDITIRFVKAFPQWRVDGIDGAASMLKIGQKAIESRGLQTQIGFHQVYVPRDKAPQAAYDFIFSNSLLHHLADPLDLWRSLQSLSKSHTPIFIMDLMRPESQAIASSLVQQYAADEPDVLQTDFYNSLLAAYTLDEVRQQLQQTGLPHLQLQIISDRHWVAWGYPNHN